MKRKSVLILAVLVLWAAFLFTAAGCGRNADGDVANKTEPQNEQVRIVLDWTPNTNHTGIYVADEKGWFAEEGLDVDILIAPEDGALLLVGSGKAEFGVDFQESLGPALAGKNPLPLIAVAAVISHNTSGLMSLTETGIKRPRDLEGKRFASWETPFVHAVIREIVEKDGGNFDAVTMIPNTAVDAFSALATDVDSIWIFYAWDGIAAEVRGVQIDYLDLGTLDPALDFYTPVIVANTNWAAAHPETAKKFLRAVSRGYYFAMENPAEAAKILLAYAPELDRELVMKSQEYLASRYGENPLAVQSRWGEIDGGRWGAFYRWMYERKLLERDIGSGGFTNEYLP